MVVDVIDLLSHDNDINGDGLETMVKAVKNCEKYHNQHHSSKLLSYHTK